MQPAWLKLPPRRRACGIGQIGYGQSLDTDAIQTEVRGKVVGLNADDIGVTSSQPDPDTVQVVVTYPFGFITPLNALAGYVLNHTLGTDAWQISRTANMLKQ